MHFAVPYIANCAPDARLPYGRARPWMPAMFCRAREKGEDPARRPAPSSSLPGGIWSLRLATRPRRRAQNGLSPRPVHHCPTRADGPISGPQHHAAVGRGRPRERIGELSPRSPPRRPAAGPSVPGPSDPAPPNLDPPIFGLRVFDVVKGTNDDRRGGRPMNPDFSGPVGGADPIRSVGD